MKSCSGQIVGHNVITLEKVSSTNDYLKSIADKTINEGTVVVANTQTHGRGRNDKKWSSAPGKGLTFSVLLRPEIKVAQLLIFSYIPVIVLTKFLINHFNIKAGIKWPNDVYAGHKKIAGILSESSSYKNHLKYFICGIGMNCNQKIHDFADDLSETATSLAIILKKNVDKELFLFNFLKEFDLFYTHIKTLSNWEYVVVKQWNCLCMHMDSRVQLTDENKATFYGVFKGISQTGDAIIETDRNIIKTINMDHFSLRENHVISD